LAKRHQNYVRFVTLAVVVMESQEDLEREAELRAYAVLDAQT